ncbi:hypothetical protein CAT723_22400 [Corynebacterium ammoniagenes]|uniref:Transposase n=1 Tax=Corynebacterium ammoniagenes TaxID=1697 RepID=A0AAV5G9M3_CORAM|nr:hypothetical protein CAT723_22400 [Corynebacterium ammoniagenes]
MGFLQLCRHPDYGRGNRGLRCPRDRNKFTAHGHIRAFFDQARIHIGELCGHGKVLLVIERSKT